MANGKHWAEESINYHFMLLKACVESGWNQRFGESKRPYYWVRGITAGAQRFGIHWTGDLCDNWSDMAYQVLAMQSAGISGFPYFNHDAGAHYAGYGNNKCGKSSSYEKLFRQWDMAFGSFTPIWKPHGPSHKRWPLQQIKSASRSDAMKYCRTRYEMIPFIYSYAILAARTGMPMVRSMFFEDPANETAWQKDMQYYWGKEILVAPNCSDGDNNISVWLPKGDWYDFWDDKKMSGNKTVNYSAATGVIPVFIKAGAVIPKAPYALSTFWIPQDSLNIHIYTGADGEFTLYEDDGVTEKYQTKNEVRTTLIQYKNESSTLKVNGARGIYDRAPDKRAYKIIYHGLSAEKRLYLNGSLINPVVWNSSDKTLTASIPYQDTKSSFIVSTDKNPVGIGSINRHNLSVCSTYFLKNKFTLLSASNIGPVSFTLFSMNGRVVQKKVDMKPKRGGIGYSCSCQYHPVSSGLYIAQIKNGDSNILRHVLIQ
jgi:alpha-D-xyloside xylohydrolase